MVDRALHIPIRLYDEVGHPHFSYSLERDEVTMKTEFNAAITAIAAERGIPRERIVEQVEKALVAAYRKSLGEKPPEMKVEVKIDDVKGEPHVYSELLVVEEVDDPRFEISIADARKIDPSIEEGESVFVETTPKDFGRIAAQTAKQIILQGIRDVEKDNVYSEFAERKGELIVGTVRRVVNRTVIIDLGKAEAVLPADQQVESDNYRIGSRLQVLLKEIARDDRSTRLIVSRKDNDLVRRIFEMEVPEILNGTVEIKSIARDPGIRTKIAVLARVEGLDPVGACVGQRGMRIQNIVNELNGEKIDVVQWSSDIREFIANALSPAQVAEVQIRESEKAVVIVSDKHLSLAIGKAGQNVRLAARLTKWSIDIKSATVFTEEIRSANEIQQQVDAQRMANDVALQKAKVEELHVDQHGMIYYQDVAYGPLGNSYVDAVVHIRATPNMLYIYNVNDNLITSFTVRDDDDDGIDYELEDAR